MWTREQAERGKDAWEVVLEERKPLEGVRRGEEMWNEDWATYMCAGEINFLVQTWMWKEGSMV